MSNKKIQKLFSQIYIVISRVKNKNYLCGPRVSVILDGLTCLLITVVLILQNENYLSITHQSPTIWARQKHHFTYTFHAK